MGSSIPGSTRGGEVSPQKRLDVAVPDGSAFPQSLGAVTQWGWRGQPLDAVATETFITAVPSTHCLKILTARPHGSSLSYLQLDFTKNVVM